MYKDATNMHKMALQDKHHDVVDGTIGVLLDDDKNLIYSKVFDEEMNKLQSNKYNYAPVSGGNAYCEAIRNYFNIPTEYTIVATPGATGAISMFMMKAKKEKNVLLIPINCWANYESIAAQQGYEIRFYDEDHDFGSFDNYDNVIVVINTPASNPIGKTYTKEELDKYIDYLKKFDNVKVFFDLAYYDFSDNQDFIFQYGKNNKTYFAVSLSKSLGVYGLRLGALVAPINNGYELAARTVWSSCNHQGILAFVNCIPRKDEIILENKAKKDLVDDRAQYFINLLKERNIEFYDFQEGFFVTIKTKDSDKIIQYLIDNHYYTIKTTDGIRVAVCSLTKDEMFKIANKIYEYQIACNVE